MTEEKAVRGRPRVALEDNETRERILNTAQRLFAAKGFSKVTLRELTAAADTNLAMVSYYFGSKDQLLLALIRRAAKSVRAERLRLLEKAQQTSGTTTQRVRQVMHALLAPVILHNGESETGMLYGTLMARTMADNPPELSNVLVRQTKHLDPFVQALQQLLPALPLPELYWRLHFALNIEHALATELPRLQHFSGGLCDTQDQEGILNRVLDFVVSGLMVGNTTAIKTA